ncbi:Peroxisomal (S)-2-hydroxy-acid oxidase GLO5 [Brachionus plicatilis]|uniref:Peroxisomal (S)-2-hydroxy-acid oxidase GLO5 n=1 Tax=Brachionus plicatilis TaxID=10195 RepID=A0A3M7RHN2_BRAPC|nr:Peroxisomal (S)-2-hydroxy-acid oxidase GLO5 [Brachionus plicatilis]
MSDATFSINHLNGLQFKDFLISICFVKSPVSMLFILASIPSTILPPHCQTLNDNSYCSPPHTSRPSSYPSNLKNHFLLIANKPPAITGLLEILDSLENIKIIELKWSLEFCIIFCKITKILFIILFQNILLALPITEVFIKDNWKK